MHQVPGDTRGGSSSATSAGVLFQYVRSGVADTRPELAKLTGRSRSTIGSRLDALLDLGLLIEDGEAPSTGGRKAGRLRFAPDSGVVLVADLGATHARIALTDLDGHILAEERHDIAIADGPDEVLAWVERQFAGLLDQRGRGPGEVVGIGVGLPGPVEHETGSPVSPPIMPGWDGYSVSGRFSALYACPVHVDNDVNLMGLGEYWTDWHDQIDDLLFVKVGTGIGCGIVTGGRIQRGAQGAAGDLGHVRVPGYDDVTCRCGNTGCVEAVAAGQALAEQLAAMGYDTSSTRDVLALVRSGNGDATHLVRRAGRVLAEVIAVAVSCFNPAVVLIGGDLATANEHLLAGIREVVYQRSLPLATRHLRILPSRLGDHAGIRGGAAMVLDAALAPDAIDARIDGVQRSATP